MTTHLTFMDGLYDWLLLVTGFNADNIFRRDQQNPDRDPGVEWATYKVISGDVSDYPLEKSLAVGTAKEELDIKRIHPGTTIVSVNIYAEDGADVLKNLYASRMERNPRELLKDAGGVLLSMNGPRDLSLLSETTWKARHQAVFTFNTFTQRIERDFIVDITHAKGKMETDEVEIYVERPTGGN